MISSWTGLLFCSLVIYFGVVHGLSHPTLLLNSHALILVLGGTFAIAFLTYPASRLKRVMKYLIHGFLFRAKRSESEVARDLVTQIDIFFGKRKPFETPATIHPFLREAIIVLGRSEVPEEEMDMMLRDRRDMIRRMYIDDARILNNIAKYPPHLGLLGAASGMIEMMVGLGTGGVDTIGAAMATALTATLWGVGLNNFVFLPLSDHSMKVAEDEIHIRDMIIDCCMMMKRGDSYNAVLAACFNRLTFQDHSELFASYNEYHQNDFNKVA